MPTMITFRAAIAALLAAGLVLAACSTEQQDWRSAEAADTTEAYARFIEQHPDSELARQAHARMDQLAEERDWQRTRTDGTLGAYREFLTRYPTGRYSQEARIRIESAALGSIPRIAPQTPEAQAAPPSGVKLLQLATAGRGAPAQSPPSTPGAPPPPPAAGTPAESTPAGLPPPAESAPAALPPAGPPDPVAAGYAVQLGAFGTQARADREWQRLQSRFAEELAGYTPRVVAADTQVGGVYRLQVAAAGEREARALCDTLRQQSQSCIPVLSR
jgi:cell division septation protein DedD